MTASANISTETKTDVVGIPIQSVAVRTIDQLIMEGEEIEDAEKRFVADDDGFVEIVFCLESNGSVVARQVKTGIQSDNMIEIQSGIEIGEEVVTGSYRAISTDLQNGAQVSVNNAKDRKSEDA
jgi:HlyD family secretion protein